ncbi:hypothetical protein [Rhodospira trueperi]|uniref:Uncharacterized protein n=1 Tax=Rhodospira trueperi TaxID=69960 RepID=A0A1G6XV22_9PROT|nr:hypothetical protein [Rhodospira trueperi]SDD81862.1 hypothetical protein SAMN05421720_101643 [Rhodospira trueperi]
MTGARSPLDRGANALIRAGADLRTAGAAMDALTADLDDPLLLDADRFADLVDPETADDRLAAALARLANGPGTGGDTRRATEGPRPQPKETGKATPHRDPAAMPPSAASVFGVATPPPAGAESMRAAKRESSFGDRKAPINRTERPERAAVVPASGDGVSPNTAQDSPRVRSAPLLQAETDPTRPGHAHRRAAPASRGAGAARTVSPADGPSAPASPALPAAPAFSTKTAPVQPDTGLPMALRRALLSGDPRAVAAEIARAAPDVSAPEQPVMSRVPLGEATEPRDDPGAGPFATAETRIARALERLERGAASRPAGPSTSHAQTSLAARQPVAEHTPPAPTPSPTPAPKAAPILVDGAPSGLRRLAERAGAAPVAAAVPEVAANGAARGDQTASSARSDRTRPHQAYPDTPLAASPAPSAPPGPLDRDDDVRLAERLTDLLRREARAQGIGGDL